MPWILITAALWGICYAAAATGQHLIAVAAGMASCVTMALGAQSLQGGGTTIRDSYNSTTHNHLYGSGAGGVGDLSSGAPITIKRKQRVDVKLIPDVHIDDSALREALRLIAAGEVRPDAPGATPLTPAKPAPQSLPASERAAPGRPALTASQEPVVLVPIGSRGGKMTTRKEDDDEEDDEKEKQKKRGFVAFALLGPPRKPPAKRN